MNTGPANFVADDILHLPKGTLIARYTKIFFVFSCRVLGTMYQILRVQTRCIRLEHGCFLFPRRLELSSKMLSKLYIDPSSVIPIPTVGHLYGPE
jgi:hypothetical protein